MGGAKTIIATLSQPETVSEFMVGLALRGRLVLLGVGQGPLPVLPVILSAASVASWGQLSASLTRTKKALTFSVLTGARTQIEMMPLEKAFEAYQKMKSGDVKFRMVLTVK